MILLQIGHNHAVDASQKEEACCLARLIMAVTASGSVTAMVKEGQGSLDPDSVTEMMQVLSLIWVTTILITEDRVVSYLLYMYSHSCVGAGKVACTKLHLALDEIPSFNKNAHACVYSHTHTHTHTLSLSLEFALNF